MQFIGSTKKFGFLAQEAHLAKNSILSSFDLLLKANYHTNLDGYFYSSFFHLTIGLERIMKLAIVSDHMVKNGMNAPTEKYLRDNFGHKINVLYSKISSISMDYRQKEISVPLPDTVDFELLEFLTKFGVKTRYFNLNQVGTDTGDKSPLEEWFSICQDAYQEYVSSSVRERATNKLFQDMDKAGSRNSFTRLLSFDGHPLTEFDIYHMQLVTKKSAPLLIWRVIGLLKPLYFVLEEIARHAYRVNPEIERQGITIPHYEEFFYFLLAMPQDIKRRKKWLGKR